MVEKHEEYSESRGQFYRFLAGIFLASVNEEIHGIFSDPDHQKGLEEWFSAQTLEAFDEFRKEGVTASLKQEFEDLFRVPGPWYTTPYESVFMDKREVAGKEVGNLLHGESAHDAERQYRRFGLKVGGTAPDLPDYIGIELSFMAHLAGLESQPDSGFTLEVVREAQKKFLQNHLGRWIPAFCERLSKKAQKQYYKGVAALLPEFLKKEAAFLGLSGSEASSGQS